MPKRVLWVDGDAPRRELVRGLLEAAGLVVDESARGDEAVTRALAAPPDLALVGRPVPDGSALGVAARLRREPALAGVPCLAVARDAGEQEAALAAGYDGVVGEPDAPARFVEQVLAALSGGRERLSAEELGVRARLARLERLRSAFVHDLAHELSTPLTPIAGYLKILQSERLGPVPPQQRKVIDAMASSVTKLARIVGNLADFANLEAGQAAISPGPVDPDGLAREVVEELRDAARDARVHLEVRPSGGGLLLADRGKLRQALCNVVQNAIKFSPHGGEVLVDVGREGDRLRFSVYDQGPGVTAPQQERIFEPFQHADRRDEARPPGSGLGLPVARRIAEAHGGHIAVESPPHAQPDAGPSTRAHQYPGAKFVIDIPAVPVVSRPEPPAQVSGA